MGPIPSPLLFNICLDVLEDFQGPRRRVRTALPALASLCRGGGRDCTLQLGWQSWKPPRGKASSLASELHRPDPGAEPSVCEQGKEAPSQVGGEGAVMAPSDPSQGLPPFYKMGCRVPSRASEVQQRGVWTSFHHYMASSCSFLKDCTTRARKPWGRGTLCSQRERRVPLLQGFLAPKKPQAQQQKARSWLLPAC